MSLGRKRRLVSPPRWLVLHLLAGWAGSRVLHELFLLPEESPVRGYGRGRQKVWPVAVYGFSRHGMVGAFLWRIFFMGHLGLRADWMLPNARVAPRTHTHAHSALRTIIITSSQSHPIKRRKTLLATSCTNQYLIKDAALLPNVSGNKPNQRAYCFLGAPLLAPVPADISVW